MYFPALKVQYVLDCSYSKRHSRKLFQLLWTALFQVWVNFTPCLDWSHNPRCALFQSHTYRDRKLVTDKTFPQSRKLFLQ